MLGNLQGVSRRMHCHRLRQVGERLGRDIFKLGGDHVTMRRQVVERFAIVVGAGQVLAGESTGRAMRIWIEHDDVVTEAARGNREHAPKLPAAEHSDSAAGKSGHLFDGR